MIAHTSKPNEHRRRRVIIIIIIIMSSVQHEDIDVSLRAPCANPKHPSKLPTREDILPLRCIVYTSYGTDPSNNNNNQKTTQPLNVDGTTFESVHTYTHTLDTLRYYCIDWYNALRCWYGTHARLCLVILSYSRWLQQLRIYIYKLIQFVPPLSNISQLLNHASTQATKSRWWWIQWGNINSIEYYQHGI